MLDSDPAAPIEPYVAMLARAVISACRAAGLPLPHLVLEPGRSLIARAGMALYTVGARKEIPGVHTYVAIDGGMADNIRPALYGARYTAFLVNPSDPPLLRSRETVSIAGKYCESGDVLIHDVTLPAPRAGDLLAIPMVGAYSLAMASNYNLALRPAVVMVSRGRAREIQRRERYDDLLRREESLAPARRFRKYQALGNDYIVLDRRDWPASPRPDTVRRICDRHRGVGADGVLWGPLPAPGGAYGLRLFNPDGAEFEVSGNGVRIFARYLLDQHLAAGPEFTIVTPAARIHACALDGRGEHIALQMGYLQFAEQPIVLNVAGVAVCGVAVNIGNPHCVVFLSDQPAELLRKYHAEGEPTPALAQALGPVIEHDPRFPNQTNVQFAQPLDPHTLRIEIWERGAGYTLASGTSSCAAAGAAIRRGDCANPVSVQMPGGEMLVEVDEHGSVTLTGPVEFAFEGEFAGDIAEI